MLGIVMMAATNKPFRVGEFLYAERCHAGYRYAECCVATTMFLVPPNTTSMMNIVFITAVILNKLIPACKSQVLRIDLIFVIA